jgi:hypothetical protein
MWSGLPCGCALEALLPTSIEPVLRASAAAALLVGTNIAGAVP